jgi:hypothetical protein
VTPGAGWRQGREWGLAAELFAAAMPTSQAWLAVAAASERHNYLEQSIQDSHLLVS